MSAIFYADDRNNRIVKVPTGMSGGTTVYPMSFEPNGITCGSDNYLYAVGEDGIVRKLNPVTLAVSASFSVTGKRTYGIGASPDGFLYIVSPGRLEKRTLAGVLVTAWTTGDILTLGDPDDIAWDPSGGGRLAITNAGDSKIYYVDPSTGSILGSDDLGYDSDDIGICYDPVRESFLTSGGSEGYTLLASIDITGSMSDEIATARTQTRAMAQALESTGYTLQYGVITFKDYVAWALGPTPGTATQYDNAIAALTANGGADLPEFGYDSIATGCNTMFQGIASGDIPYIPLIVHVTDAPSHYAGDGSGATYNRASAISELNKVNAISYVYSDSITAVEGGYGGLGTRGFEKDVSGYLSSLSSDVRSHMLNNHPPVRSDESIRILGGSSYTQSGSVYGLAYWPRFAATRNVSDVLILM